MRRLRRAELLIVALAIAAAIAPGRPLAVERWYSTAAYPLIQRPLTSLTNLFPFALFDVLVVGAVAALIILGWRVIRFSIRTRRGRPLIEGLGHLVAAAAAGYLLFLLLWGLNYRRVPMDERLVLGPEPPSTEAVVRLGVRAADEMNQLHEAAHAEGWDGAVQQDPLLRGAFGDVLSTLSDATPAVPARLKQTIFGLYFRWAGVDGMINPFGLETLANPDLLPFERPFVAAHEWAHLAGYADESEANFVGWLTTLRASEAARYSGWLYLYWQVSGELPADERRQLSDALADGPRRDVAAIVDRLRRGQWPMLRRAGWAVYDQYLKANRVKEGIRSYGAVITLILRGRFDEGRPPVRRDRAAADGDR